MLVNGTEGMVHPSRARGGSPTAGMIIPVAHDNALSRELIRELLNILSKCGLSDVKLLRRSSDVQRPGYFDDVP
jgi:hypothetical protein